jgi:hypothetical protein
MRTTADVTDHSKFMGSHSQASYNKVAFVITGLRLHLRVLLPPGTSAVEVGMLPQRPALAGLGSADPFH